MTTVFNCEDPVIYYNVHDLIKKYFIQNLDTEIEIDTEIQIDSDWVDEFIQKIFNSDESFYYYFIENNNELMSPDKTLRFLFFTRRKQEEMFGESLNKEFTMEKLVNLYAILYVMECGTDYWVEVIKENFDIV